MSQNFSQNESIVDVVGSSQKAFSNSPPTKENQSLLGKRKSQEEINPLHDSQDIEFENETLNETVDLKLENEQLKQSLLLLILGSDLREEWPARWQELVWKVVNERILRDCSLEDQTFNEEFVMELTTYFGLGQQHSNNIDQSKQSVKEWIRTKIKPSAIFNSLLEPISKKIKMTLYDSEEIEEDSPIF